MGGNAIKNARRIYKTEYEDILAEIYEKLPTFKLEPVKAFRSKNDFGDIDIVVEIDDTIDQRELIRNTLHIDTEYNNGPFFSVDYKGVQIDFIFMNKDNYHTALNYFHWNDLGNFIGRTARSLNFKYGHDGLSYDKHYSDHYKISVHVSNDTKKILTFLGYDYNTWAKGFDTKEEIFEYAASSKYFNATYFSLEEQAHNDRVRNRKRKMYQLMLEYINQNAIVGKPKLTQEERLIHYNRAKEIFGDTFDLEVKEAEKKYNISLEVKKLFNGDIISQITGLTGKELGEFIRTIRTNEKDLSNRILEGGNGFVKQLIIKYKGE